MKLVLIILVFLSLHSATAGDSAFETITKLGKEDRFECLLLGDTYFSGTENVDNYGTSFIPFKSFLADSDYSIANLETPCSSLACSPLNGLGKATIHNNPDGKLAQALATHSIRAVSLGNNHSIDFGPAGLRQTQNKLNTLRVKTFGAGENLQDASKPLLFSVALKNERNFNFAVIGAFERRPEYGSSKYDAYADKRRPGVNPLEIESIRKDVQDIRKIDPNTFIILFPHWGRKFEKINLEQQITVQELWSLGLNAIIGHGAHTAQPVIKGRDRIAAFCIGNFIHHSKTDHSKTDYSTERSFGFSFLVKLIKPLNEEYIKFRFYPIYVDSVSDPISSHFVNEDEFEEVIEYTHISQEEESSIGKDEHGYYIEYQISDRIQEYTKVDISSFPVMKSYSVSAALYESEERTRQRIERSKYRAPFSSLFENYEPQITSYSCPITSSVVVLNALKFKGSDPNLIRHTQDGFIDIATVQIKNLREIMRKQRMEEGKKIRGLLLHDLANILKVYGLQVIEKQAVIELSDEEMFNDLKQAMLREETYVIVNFARPLIAQVGAGHFSPIAAYDELEDAFLVLDTNLRRGQWLWIPRGMLLRSMREFKNEIRGYLIISKD